MMQKNKIAIATMSWARDEAEEKLLRSSLAELAATGLPVYITDGGSNDSFLSFLDSFANFTVCRAETKGLWAQVKKSLDTASQSEAEYIFYTEPDKGNFFRQSLSAFLDIQHLPTSCGVRIASRSPAAFAGFPPFQQMTETTINNCCAEVAGKYQDYTYGPFLLKSSIVRYLEQLKADIGWGWRPFVFCLVHRLGYSIDTVTGDFFCPPDQREDDANERIYRMKQLQQNIEGIVLSTTACLVG